MNALGKVILGILVACCVALMLLTTFMACLVTFRITCVAMDEMRFHLRICGEEALR